LEQQVIDLAALSTFKTGIDYTVETRKQKDGPYFALPGTREWGMLTRTFSKSKVKDMAFVAKAKDISFMVKAKDTISSKTF